MLSFEVSGAEMACLYRSDSQRPKKMIRGSDSVTVHSNGLERLVRMLNDLDRPRCRVNIDAIIAYAVVSHQYCVKYTDIRAQVRFNTFSQLTITHPKVHQDRSALSDQ